MFAVTDSSTSLAAAAADVHVLRGDHELGCTSRNDTGDMRLV